MVLSLFSGSRLVIGVGMWKEWCFCRFQILMHPSLLSIGRALHNVGESKKKPGDSGKNGLFYKNKALG